MDLFEELGVPLKTERGRRVFPVSDKAQDIVSAMERACIESGVRIVNKKVDSLIIEDVMGAKLYSKEQARRHEVRPGITGWAQVNGRNAISWQKKFELDVWYVDNCTLWTDIKIIWITIMKVLKRADISQEGQATMEVFNGNN